VCVCVCVCAFDLHSLTVHVQGERGEWGTGFGVLECVGRWVQVRASEYMFLGCVFVHGGNVNHMGL